MASVNVKVETDNMKEIRREMLLKIVDIEKMLDETNKKIEDSKTFFDTPSAACFREKVALYIGKQKQVLSTDIKPFIDDALLEIINIYDEEYDVEKKVVGNNNSTSN